MTYRVIGGLYAGVTTIELDNLAAETAATMTTKHADYAILAARIAISNLHKETKKSFSGKYSSSKINDSMSHNISLKSIVMICRGDIRFVSVQGRQEWSPGEHDQQEVLRHRSQARRALELGNYLRP